MCSKSKTVVDIGNNDDSDPAKKKNINETGNCVQLVSLSSFLASEPSSSSIEKYQHLIHAQTNTNQMTHHPSTYRHDI